MVHRHPAVNCIKRPGREVCLYIGENQTSFVSTGSTGSAFCFPYNSVTVGQILFKFGRCMQ